MKKRILEVERPGTECECKEKIKNTFVKAYFAPVTAPLGGKLYPRDRQAEIDDAKSEKVKSEKYSSWKLLEFAVKDCYKKDLSDFVFKKEQNGKWQADEFCFSISHSGGIVCVAVSDYPVGIDMENLTDFSEKTAKNKDSLFEKIATEGERNFYKNPSISLLSQLWTKKECLFKLSNEDSFLPRSIETDKKNILTKNILLLGNAYVVSVCPNVENVEFVFVEPD